MKFITNTLKENMTPSCCLQTQGLVYKFEIKDVYEDFYGNKNLFDFSDYPRD